MYLDDMYDYDGDMSIYQTDTVDRSTFPEAAAEVAAKMAERMQKAYTISVIKYIEDYDAEPDEDDFFTWLEVYDFGEVRK